MSIDGLVVCCVSCVVRGRYTPVLKNSSNTLFSFVARINCLIGRPIIRATWPAQILPKLPDGMTNETFSSLEHVAAK